MSETVLILGASGKIGRHAAAAFGAAGWTVRLYERRAGDMVRQAEGAQVIVNGLNPPNYHNWAKLVPQITAQVLDAARSSGATVIVPGNVYVFGDTPGLWSETTPHRPVSRKGRIREEMEQTYAASGVQTILLRAGDFISGTAGDTDLMSHVHLRGLGRGVVTSLGPPDTLHAYAYLPDWARCAVGLAEKRSMLPVWTDVSLGEANFTITELADTLSEALGRPLQVKEFGWWQMRLAAPVWELARELLEMRYLWATPHGLDQSKLEALLPDFRNTDLATVMCSGLGPAKRPRPTATRPT